MKHTILPIAAFAVFAAFSLTAADSKDSGPNLPNPNEPVEIRVTTGDANKEIMAKVGEIIVIELDANATTGYAWAERPGRSDSVLESKGNEYKPREMAVGMVGGPGKSFFRYLVKAPGKTELVFGYSRPWEPQTVPPAQLFNVKINAEEAKADAPKTTDAKSDSAKPAAAAKKIELGDNDNGGTIHVRPGDTIQIKLRSNPTTGYSWAEVKDKTDAKTLKSEGNEYKVNDHPAGMVGVGGSDYWTFRALAAGTTEIVLGYGRPWEKDKEPARTFKTTVVVDAAAPAATEAKTTTTPAEPKEINLSDSDNGKTVKVAVGGMVILKLDSNATTGFSWTKADKVDKDILKLERNDYMQNPNPNGMVGVGGKTVILYRALKAGTAKIDLTYMQPWEPDSKFNTNYTVTVEVTE